MHKQENKMIEAAKRGFTLVELLVVVAILGILGAIGMQGVTGHIEKTRKTAAKTGVDTIKGAITNYMIDKKKSSPPNDLSVLVTPDGDQDAFLDGGEGALYDPWDNEYKLEVSGKRFVVISAGPDVKDIAAGDKVVVGNFVGSDLKLDGVDYKFVKLEDVLAVVTD